MVGETARDAEKRYLVGHPIRQTPASKPIPRLLYT